jgi:predicted DCC family thiol-disulfide oxidoreductase YuxK
VQAHDAAGRVLALPNQTPGLLDRVGLTRAQVDRDAWAVLPADPAGHRWAGAAAINRTLRELGGVWVWLGAAYHFPPIRWLEDGVYRQVARHRHRLSFLRLTPECNRPGVPCR